MALPITVIHLLTYNEKAVEICIESLLVQEGFTLGQNLFIIASDNQSTNDTFSRLNKFSDSIKVYLNKKNYGFSKGHNLGIEKALELNAQYVFIANADIILEKNALALMVQSLENDNSAGLASPLIFRADKNINPIEPKVFDACGMFFNDNIRHLDRGSNELDNGQYRNAQYIFGGTGAALLLKRNFIEDAKFPKELDETNSELELFDNNFFLYREDAELSLRAQILGWNCLYIPSAIVYHTRVVTPENRKSIPSEFNLYSVRNRFLIQINNFSAVLSLICLKGFVIRNLLVIVASITTERSSAPGLWDIYKLFPNAYKKRKFIFAKRRRSDLALKDWFFKKGIDGVDTLKVLDSNNNDFSASVVIINYNSGDRLKDAVCTSIEALSFLAENTSKNSSIKNQIIVVDNNSSDSSLINLKDDVEAKSVTVIKNNSNLGFAAACNQGIKYSDSDYILILNPDIKLHQDTIHKLSATLHKYPEISAIGASLLNADQSIQLGFTARKFPTLLSTLFELFGIAKIFSNNLITKNYLIKDDITFSEYLSGENSDTAPIPKADTPFLVDQPAGACLLIRKKAFTEIQGFDENFFPAWFEDVDFCLRLKKFGYSLAVLSSAKATHEGGYSLSTMTRLDFLKIWYKNLEYYWQKHGSHKELLIIKAATKIALFMRSLSSSS